jgi:hypothetical protein
MDVLVDVVSVLESGMDGKTAREGLDLRDLEKRGINEIGDIQSACHVIITCTHGYIRTYGE